MEGADRSGDVEREGDRTVLVLSCDPGIRRIRNRRTLSQEGPAVSSHGWWGFTGKSVATEEARHVGCVDRRVTLRAHFCRGGGCRGGADGWRRERLHVHRPGRLLRLPPAIE